MPLSIMTLPPKSPPQVELLLGIFSGEHTHQELQELLGLSDRNFFLYLPLLKPLDVIKIGFGFVNNP